MYVTITTFNYISNIIYKQIDLLDYKLLKLYTVYNHILLNTNLNYI